MFGITLFLVVVWEVLVYVGADFCDFKFEGSDKRLVCFSFKTVWVFEIPDCANLALNSFEFLYTYNLTYRS